MGLVNTVVPLADLEAETISWARELLAQSPLALRMLKGALNAVTDGAAGMQQFAGDATLLYYMSEEAQEGRDAYVGRRHPGLLQVPAPPVTGASDRQAAGAGAATAGSAACARGASRAAADAARVRDPDAEQVPRHHGARGRAAARAGRVGRVLAVRRVRAGRELPVAGERDRVGDDRLASAGPGHNRRQRHRARRRARSRTRSWPVRLPHGEGEGGRARPGPG